MRRRKLLVALAGLAVVVAACAIVLRPFSPPLPVTSIPKAAFTRVKIGMTTAEVATILGPPGDKSTMETEQVPIDHMNSDEFFVVPDSVPSSVLSWRSDTAVVFVRFDKLGNACSGIYSRWRPSTESTLQKLLKRAKRLWHRWFP
jgi:hypothetical protein